MNIDIPKDLVFDDEPLEGMLYGVQVEKAQSADALTAWCETWQISSMPLPVILAILGKSPAKGALLKKEQADFLLGHLACLPLLQESAQPQNILQLARIHMALGKPRQAEEIFNRALDCKMLAPDTRHEALLGLAEVQEASGKGGDAKEQRILAEAEVALAGDQYSDLTNVRSLALSLFYDKRYAAAERLYRALLARDFQLPGTLVHLARVLLLQDRLLETRKAVGKALGLVRTDRRQWETASYVLHRITFLRILFKMLERRPYGHLLVLLRRQFTENPERVSWSIEPVLAHFRQYLNPGDHTLLQAMMAAIGDEVRLDALQKLPLWQNAFSFEAGISGKFRKGVSQ